MSRRSKARHRREGGRTPLEVLQAPIEIARPEAYGIETEEAGLAITSLREPVPDLGDGRNHMAPWIRMPLFLWLEVRLLAFCRNQELWI